MKFYTITRNCSRLIFTVAAVLTLSMLSFATPTVTLSPSLASPQLLGTPITWTATASDSDQGTLMYSFNYGVQGGNLPLVHDYGYGNTFPALPALQEGTYEVQVTVRNNTTGKTGSTTQTFVFNPIATSSAPVVVSPTANALVALFSTVACSSADSELVAFKNAGGIQQLTPAAKCNGKTMNFYVAGMYPSTTYSMTGVLVKWQASGTNRDQAIYYWANSKLRGHSNHHSDKSGTARRRFGANPHPLLLFQPILAGGDRLKWQSPLVLLLCRCTWRHHLTPETRRLLLANGGCQ